MQSVFYHTFFIVIYVPRFIADFAVIEINVSHRENPERLLDINSRGI